MRCHTSPPDPTSVLSPQPRSLALPRGHTHLLRRGLARRQGTRRELRGALWATELRERVRDGRQRRCSELLVFLLQAPGGGDRQCRLKAATPRRDPATLLLAGGAPKKEGLKRVSAR